MSYNQSEAVDHEENFALSFWLILAELLNLLKFILEICHFTFDMPSFLT